MGLTRIADLIPLPRAPLARRFGRGWCCGWIRRWARRPNPWRRNRTPPHFGVRMTLPEPIGLQSDVMAGLARLLDRLCAKLALHHMGARRVRLELRRVDRGTVQVEIGLARPMRDPVRIAALFAKGRGRGRLRAIGIDALRLSAPLIEPHAAGTDRGGGPGDPAEDALADLLSSRRQPHRL